MKKYRYAKETRITKPKVYYIHRILYDNTFTTYDNGEWGTEADNYEFPWEGNEYWRMEELTEAEMFLEIL